MGFKRPRPRRNSQRNKGERRHDQYLEEGGDKPKFRTLRSHRLKKGKGRQTHHRP